MFLSCCLLRAVGVPGEKVLSAVDECACHQDDGGGEQVAAQGLEGREGDVQEHNPEEYADYRNETEDAERLAQESPEHEEAHRRHNSRYDRVIDGNGEGGGCHELVQVAGQQDRQGDYGEDDGPQVCNVCKNLFHFSFLHGLGSNETNKETVYL